MSLAKVEEFVDHMNSMPNPEAGFPAAEFYKNAKEFGLKCREILEHFLGKDKAISRGRYLAIVPNVNKTLFCGVSPILAARLIAEYSSKAKGSLQIVSEEQGQAAAAPVSTHKYACQAPIQNESLHKIIEDGETFGWVDETTYIAPPSVCQSGNNDDLIHTTDY